MVIEIQIMTNSPTNIQDSTKLIPKKWEFIKLKKIGEDESNEKSIWKKKRKEEVEGRVVLKDIWWL